MHAQWMCSLGIYHEFSRYLPAPLKMLFRHTLDIQKPQTSSPTYLIPTNSQLEKEQVPGQLWLYNHLVYRDEFGRQVHFSVLVGYVSQQNGSVAILDQIWKKSSHSRLVFK